MHIYAPHLYIDQTDPDFVLQDTAEETDLPRLALFAHLKENVRHLFSLRCCISSNHHFLKGLVESLVQNGHDGLAQRAGFTEKEVVETFDKDDEEGDEEVEMVRKSVDNTDLVIFLSEVEVKYFVVSVAAAMHCLFCFS